VREAIGYGRSPHETPLLQTVLVRRFSAAKESLTMLTQLRSFLYMALLISSAAAASEATVKQAMQKRYPDVQVESVTKTPIAGIYEVFANGEVVYVDENVNYMIVRGRLMEIASGTDLTEERTRVLTATKFDQLPLDLAFRMVKGNGKRKFAYFTDPNCPFCKRLDQELARVTDVTIYVFLYPILSPDSVEKAKAVWCSKDRAKVYMDWMLNGNAPKAAGTCDTPVDKVVAYGRQKGISGTPTLFFADGQRQTGWIPANQLEKKLDDAR
jgi:thiol:disulfide interchange protein DsbC